MNKRKDGVLTEIKWSIEKAYRFGWALSLSLKKLAQISL